MKRGVSRISRKLLGLADFQLVRDGPEEIVGRVGFIGGAILNDRSGGDFKTGTQDRGGLRLVEAVADVA
jgi:hypothetical protein